MRAFSRFAALSLLAFVASAAVAQVQVNRWQDLAPYVAQQTEKLNAHTDELAELRAENATLKSDLGLVIGRYDTLLRYLIIHACLTNEKIATINSVFNWVQPFPLGNHECPPAGSRFYIPSFLSPDGPLIPPASTGSFDGFNRADGPAGEKWTKGEIVDGKLRVTGTALWVPATPADQWVEAKVTASSTSQWGYHGVVARASATSKAQYRFTFSVLDNTFGVEYIDANDQHHSLFNGALTYVPGAAMKLEVKGTKITAYYAGQKLGEVEDTRIASGSAGVIGLAGSGQYGIFDDFHAGEL